MNEYVVLLPGNDDTWTAWSEGQRVEVFARHAAFSKALATRGRREPGRASPPARAPGLATG